MILKETGSIIGQDMDKPLFFHIRVKGHLENNWADWFDGLSISNQENGEAVLSGRVPDQSTLYGILNRINNLGLRLISVNSTTDGK